MLNAVVSFGVSGIAGGGGIAAVDVELRFEVAVEFRFGFERVFLLRVLLIVTVNCGRLKRRGE